MKNLTPEQKTRLVMYEAFEAEMRELIKDGYAEERSTLLIALDSFATALELDDTLKKVPKEIREDKNLRLSHKPVRRLIRELTAKHYKTIPNGFCGTDKKTQKAIAKSIAKKEKST